MHILLTSGCGLIGSHVALHLREATTAMQEICSRSTPVTQRDKTREVDIVLCWTDNRQGTQPLGWKLKTDLRTGLVRTFDWIRKNKAELRAGYVSSN